MNVDKLINASIITLIVISTTIFYSGIWPLFLENDSATFLHAGFSLFILFSSIGLGTIIPIRPRIMSFAILFSLVFFWVSVVTFSVWAVLVYSLFHGILIGLWIKEFNIKNKFGKTIPYIGLGVFISYILTTLIRSIDVDFINSNNNEFVLLSNSILPSLITSVIYIILIVFSFRKKNDFEGQKNYDTKKNHLSILQYLLHFVMFGFVALELLIIIWSIILQDYRQSYLSQLKLPLAFLLIFILRRYFTIPQKVNNIGWLFGLSLLATLSIGLFFTFDIVVLFIIGFGVSFAYLPKIISEVFNLKWQPNLLGFFFIAIGVLMIPIGMYIENFYEFAASIHIPENLLQLSSLQALIKELATFSALMSVLLGVLFLNRRKLDALKSA
jgi:hypothetical protein